MISIELNPGQGAALRTMALVGLSKAAHGSTLR